MVQATELIGEEDAFTVALDSATDEFILNTVGNTDPSTYDLLVLRIDDEGQRVFGAEGIELDPENVLYLPFTALDPSDVSLIFDVDYDNDGEVDDSYELPDVTDEIDFYGEEE